MADINWCLWLGEATSDFLLSAEEIDTLPEIPMQDTKIFEYNQWTTPHCTLYSALWAVSDLFNYEWKQNEIDEIVEESYKRGRVKWEWWYIKLAVNLVADYWNEHHSDLGKVVYYRVSLYDTELVDKILQKNYTLCSWYKWNTAYKNDRDDNWVLNWTSFWASTYWHAVSWIGRGGKRFIKDNYKGRKKWKLSTNIYEVEHKPSELVSGWCYYADAYLYIKVDNSEEIKRLETLKTECNNCIKQLWIIRHLVNDTNFQWILHYTADKLRAKIADADRELSKYR